MMRSVVRLFVVIAIGCGCAPLRTAFAHEGPPFPILVDEPIPDYLVSVWTDPDVGEATFYVILEPGEPAASDAIPEVDVWVRPVSERLPKAVYRAAQESARGLLRYLAKPEFDAAEMWTVGVDIRRANGQSDQLITQVEATPPGVGPWGVLLYLAPFLLFGGLWGFAFLRRARALRNAARHSANTREGACR